MHSYLLTAALTVAAVVSGAIASIAGFGIGSLLTPVFVLMKSDPKVAVAAVSLPHLAGNVYRFWLLRRHVDRRVLWNFGLTSAAGGLVGALLHSRAGSPVLGYLFATLLTFAGLMGLMGWSQKMEFRGPWAWVAGGLSGVFGGLVGNQGGIRSAGMLGLKVTRESFVATATAIALMVDGARVPVYLAIEGRRMGALWPWILLATAGVVAGTAGGGRLLKQIPEKLFLRLVSGLILALGVWMFFYRY